MFSLHCFAYSNATRLLYSSISSPLPFVGYQQSLKTSNVTLSTGKGQHTDLLRGYDMAELDTTKSEDLFARAQRVIPGGVNSPVRAFRAVGRTPLFIREAAGSNIADADGNTYTDYVGSWGPMILGH